MTFSRIRCLTGHFVGRTLDPLEEKPVEGRGYTNHQVDKGLVQRLLETLYFDQLPPEVTGSVEKMHAI